MSGVWTVARHSLAQAFRMKVAAMFIAILAVTLSCLPFVMEGDGTLSGRIQTFFAYSTGVTAALLSLVTIFVATTSITSDLRGRQIYSIVTKPLARWQYVLGRWLGVVMLDAILLVAAGGIIYTMAQYMRGGEALNPTDRRTVETEVFAARVRVEPPSFKETLDRRVANRLVRLRKNNGYESALEAYLHKTGGDREQAIEELVLEIAKQEAKTIQTAAPPTAVIADKDRGKVRKYLRWRFTGIHILEKPTEGEATYDPLRRLYVQVLPFKAKPSLIARLVYRGPVRVGNVDGRVYALDKDYFHVKFPLEDIRGKGLLAELKPGATLPVEIDPTIQISYKAKPSGRAPGGKLLRNWQIKNPQTLYMEERFGSDQVRIASTLVVSARVVSEAGETEVTYINRSPTSVAIINQDISVLYRRGSFEVNFFKAMLLVMCQLIFLAALGILAGTFVSFPVACLICFASLPFSLAREFLTGAVKITKTNNDLMTIVGHYIMEAMGILLPDFATTSAGVWLIDGIFIPWSYVIKTAGIVTAIQTIVLLAVASFIFHKRELAQAQG